LVWVCVNLRHLRIRPVCRFSPSLALRASVLALFEMAQKLALRTATEFATVNMRENVQSRRKVETVGHLDALRPLEKRHV